MASIFKARGYLNEVVAARKKATNITRQRALAKWVRVVLTGPQEDFIKEL